ncbi:MAG: 1-phosphofructokinase [Clostridiales bacterium]|nr:1-phosphofructokinase [Clostridiales bacterium]
MIYTITLNPCIDYTVNINEWNRGKVNRTQKEVCYVGGKGINVSIVLKNLGNPNVAMGFVGGFTGREIERLLVEQHHVSTDFVQIEGDSRINVKVMSGDETQFNGAGPKISESAVKEFYDKLSILKNGDYLIMAGSIPSCMSQDTYEDIMEYLKGKGVNFVVDATKDLLLNTLKHKPFLIKPNNHELEEMFKIKLNGFDDTYYYAGKLREMGARNVIVSLGKYGAILVSENGDKIYLQAPDGDVVDTVGSGDSVVAGFISEYIQSGDYVRAFYRGVATGSATAFSETLATKEESDLLFNRIYKK